MKKILLVIFAAVAYQNMVQATVQPNDIFAPDWRGQERTVMGRWESWGNTAAGGYILPDSWKSDLGQGITGDASIGGVLLNEFDGRMGVIELTDDYQMDFWLPNYPELNQFKEILLQVTYFADENVTVIPDVEPVYNEPVEEPFISAWQLVDSQVHADGWITEAYSIVIGPGPQEEYIALNFSDYTNAAYVDQVVIDTISVPEPATVLVLGLGSCFTFLSRNRKRSGK